MQMDFRLLDGNDPIFRSIGADENRKHLADADTDIPVTDYGICPAIHENELTEFVAVIRGNPVLEAFYLTLRISNYRIHTDRIRLIVVIRLQFHSVLDDIFDPLQ